MCDTVHILFSSQDKLGVATSDKVRKRVTYENLTMYHWALAKAALGMFSDIRHQQCSVANYSDVEMRGQMRWDEVPAF